MAMKTKSSTQSRAKSRMLGAVIAVAFAVFIVILVGISTSEDKKVVSVVRLKDNISANAMITADMIEEYKMYYGELANYGASKSSSGVEVMNIVEWKYKDKVVGQRYAAYYLRGGTVLFWDQTVKEQTKKNSYLYSMEGELLNIQMNTKDFGDMVIPGDVINVRAVYTDTEYDLTSEEEFRLNVESGLGVSKSVSNGVQVQKSELLFSEVSILDMLNSSGASIFDIYYDYISKSKAEQSALLQSEEFLKSVKPSTILLEVTAEEADRYMEVQSKSPEYLMTLLPRTGSNAILDSLSEIQSALAGTSSGNSN